MKIEFDTFSVDLTGELITYSYMSGEGKPIAETINTRFKIHVSDDYIEIKHTDAFCSEMIFKWHKPSDKEGMFKMIARAYGISLPEEKPVVSAVDYLIQQVEFYFKANEFLSWPNIKQNSIRMFREQIAMAHEDGIPQQFRIIGAKSGTYPKGNEYYEKIYGNE